MVISFLWKVPGEKVIPVWKLHERSFIKSTKTLWFHTKKFLFTIFMGTPCRSIVHTSDYSIFILLGVISDGNISVAVYFSKKYRHFYKKDLIWSIIRIDDYSGVLGGVPLKIVRYIWRNCHLKLCQWYQLSFSPIP